MTRQEYDDACGVLGIPTTADRGAAQAAHRALAQALHPDRNPTEGAEMARVNAAWNTLKEADFKRPPLQYPGGAPRPFRQQQAKPPTIQVEAATTLEAVLFGGVVQVRFPIYARCDHRTIFGICFRCGGTGHFEVGTINKGVRIQPGQGISGPVRVPGKALGYLGSLLPEEVFVTLDVLPNTLSIDGRAYVYNSEIQGVTLIQEVPWPLWILGGELEIRDPHGGVHRTTMPPGRFDGADDSMTVSEPVPGGIPHPGGGKGPLVVVCLPSTPKRGPTSLDRMTALLWALQAELVPGTQIPPGVGRVRVSGVKPEKVKRPKKKAPAAEPTPPEVDVIDAEFVDPQVP